MNATTTNRPEAAAKAPAAPKRELELPALVAIMWSLAGGMLLGGAGVALRMFAGQMSAHLMLVATSTLFVIGAGTVAYGEIMAVIDAAAPYVTKVGIVTDGMRAEAAGQAKKGK